MDVFISKLLYKCVGFERRKLCENLFTSVYYFLCKCKGFNLAFEFSLL
uniref:Uncharacterized protein n=1 Tax=Physcomitrium patens TaxID=3218 RepID=A0A2K1IC06_PHYPA|nr:hypothetical protein PHYPA_030277 [Physcomitrium patens]